LSVREPLAAHCSPPWLAHRFRSNLRRFGAAWCREWPDTRVAYSSKTNRLLAFMQAADADGADAEVVCEAEYVLAAAVIEADPAPSCKKTAAGGPIRRRRACRRTFSQLSCHLGALERGAS
jgi:diaminopimelate decarboxylase